VGFVRPISEPDTISSVTRAYAPRQVDRDEYANAGAELRLLHTYTLLGKPGNLATGVRVYRGTTQRYQQGKGTTGSDLDLSLTDPVYGRELGFGTNNFAVFAENVFNVGKNVSIVPGVRYEQIVSTVDGYLNTSSTGNLAPDRSERQVLLFGTGLEYRTTTSTNAYANFSTAYRPVLYSELTPSATTDIIDPDLKDANGYNLEAGYRGSLARYVTFDVGVFQLLYRDRIGTVQRDGAAYRTNIGTSLSQGVEAYVEVDVLRLVAGERPASLRVHASVTWMDARYTSWNNPALVNDPVRGIEGKRVEYAPSNIERYGVNYQRKGFSATVQLSRTGPVYTDAANTEEPNAAATVGRLAGYQVLDIHGGHTFRNGLELRLGVNNLMDEVYATRRAGGYPGPGVLPGNGRTFLVTLGARL
jgi:Fe(3+) dicitrate transport protein